MYNKPSPVEKSLRLLADSLQAMEIAIAKAKASSKGENMVDAKPVSLNRRKVSCLDARILILDIDLQILRLKNRLREVSVSDQESVSEIQIEIALLQSLASKAQAQKA